MQPIHWCDLYTSIYGKFFLNRLQVGQLYLYGVCSCQDNCNIYYACAQERNKVRWHPGWETSLAPLCLNLSSFRSKCTVLKEVLMTLLGLFSTLHSDSAPGKLCLLALCCAPECAVEIDQYKSWYLGFTDTNVSVLLALMLSHSSRMHTTCARKHNKPSQVLQC